MGARALSRQRILRAAAGEFEDEEREIVHAHADEGQLKWAARGVMSVPTTAGTWVAPPSRAVWIPPGVLHGGIMTGRVEFVSVYVSEAHCAGLPERCCAVTVSSALQEALLDAGERHDDYPSRENDERTLAVLQRELGDAGIRPLRLGVTRSARLGPALAALEREPSDDRTLAAWAESLGMSPRSLARACRLETGLSFGELRTQLRLLAALQRLARGEGVAEVAERLGYNDASAFISMFRRELGTTPGRYFASA